MNKNWLTYLIVISLGLLWSCADADMVGSEGMKEDFSAKEISAEGENEIYVEASEESATEEMVEEESFEYYKDVPEEESYAVITKGQLIALQGRAEQKVNELFEYVTIMSNEEYDMEMRKNAKKMASNLFESKAKLYAPSLLGNEDSVAVTIVLKDILKGKVLIENMSVEDVDVADDETVYCKIIANNVGFRLFFEVNMEFETKKFGEETLKVWTVYLSNVGEQ